MKKSKIWIQRNRRKCISNRENGMKEGTEKYVWPSWPAFVWGIRCIKGNRVRCWKTRLRTDPGGGQGEMWLEPTNLGVNRDWNRS